MEWLMEWVADISYAVTFYLVGVSSCLYVQAWLARRRQPESETWTPLSVPVSRVIARCNPVPTKEPAND